MRSHRCGEIVAGRRGGSPCPPNASLSIIGGPEVLRTVEDEDPRAGPGEVRVKVLAAGVVHRCPAARRHVPPGAPKPPFTPGYELVGVVEELGPSCSRLRVGDRVAALTVWGADAERVCVPEAGGGRGPRGPRSGGGPEPRPDLHDRLPGAPPHGEGKAGETVLVHGAAGRVGTAASSSERWPGFASTGPLPLATAPRSSGSARWRSTTATRTSWPGARGSPAKGVDVVLDGLGGAVSLRSFRALRPADGSSCSATTPRSRTGARSWPGGSSGTRRPRPWGSGACSRPAGGCSPYRIQKLRDRRPGASRGESAARLVGGGPRDPVVPGGLRRAARAAPVRTRSTRSSPSACRCLTRGARTSCWRARRRRESSCSSTRSLRASNALLRGYGVGGVAGAARGRRDLQRMGARKHEGRSGAIRSEIVFEGFMPDASERSWRGPAEVEGSCVSSSAAGALR